MPTKAELRRLKAQEVNGLRGKLVEVRRIGTNPIFISVTKTDSVKRALEKADIPVGDYADDEIKVEGIPAGKRSWVSVKLNEKIVRYDRIAVTTKVSGARE